MVICVIFGSIVMTRIKTVIQHVTIQWDILSSPSVISSRRDIMSTALSLIHKIGKPQKYNVTIIFIRCAVILII